MRQLPRVSKTIAVISQMGQREIARTYAACVRNLLCAGGAGLVTALTVALKVLILHSPLPLLAGAALSAGNLILSFLFMQLVGFRLATKQAPLLGAALGGRWRELKDKIVRGKHFRKMWRDEVNWSVRTQAFSASGNFIFVIPAAFLFCTVFRLRTGTQFLDPQAARAALESLHPWRTATLGYAALTGALLWLSTYVGSAVAHRFRPFSKVTATALFNICLGILLAFVPFTGKALGLALDVRHFTLSSGTVVLAVVSLGVSRAWQAGLPAALLGVLAIGLLNFAVSFALAFMAARMQKEVS